MPDERRNSHVQDVIVGSGAGGGLLAARLAEMGRAVCVVEEGSVVSSKDFTQREDAMYSLLYRDGGGQQTEDGSIAVLQGRCLGGSTTVNMGDCVPIEGEVIEHWRKRYGWGDWGGTTNGDIAAAGARAMAEMGASVATPEQFNRNNSLLRDGAEKLKMKGSALAQNRVGCVGSGYCTIGCAYDAKRGTLVVHLPKAKAAGAEIWTDACVQHIHWEGRKATAVSGMNFTVYAERIFLCAGTIHTPGILHRSGVTRSGVGKNLSLQPQIPVVGIFPDRVDFHRGIPQVFGVNGSITATSAAGLSGFTIESVSAGPAMTAAMLPLPLAKLKPLLAKYRNLAACLCLVPDAPGGSLHWEDGWHTRIRYSLQQDWWTRAKDAMKAAIRIYLAMGATEVRVANPHVPPFHSERDLSVIDTLRLRPADFAMISAHPQGTCRMGSGRSDIVVDPDFRLKDTENVYVCDASIFPTSSSTHTMVPVMAMAEILASRLNAR